MILSVVIPCYNHGQYLQEAIDSVLTYRDQPIEIIIVDDGSTDVLTINKINELKKEGYHVIQHKNSGLSFSRNVGISVAKGKYILPLDADNKIKSDYIRKGIKLLEQEACDIVYGNPIFFGENKENRKFKVRPFNGTDLIFTNYIDACAIFRKEVWIKNKGYDEKMPYVGYEDWEFWLNSFLNNFVFYHLDEDLYYYRIVSGSMFETISADDINGLSYEYIIKKHAISIINVLGSTRNLAHLYEYDAAHPLRSSLKHFYHFIKSKIC